MSIATEVVYQDGVTVVSAAWLNLIQEHLAGWLNMNVTAAGQVVTIAAAADDDAASAYINGEMRLNESDITFTFTGAEATDTFDVYIVGDGAGPDFTMEVVSGAAVGTNTRKIAEVDYDTTADEITDLRVIRGNIEEHDHAVLSGAGAISHTDLLNPDVGDQHTQYIHEDGSRAFSAVVVGITPAVSTDIATKGYADGLLTSGVPVGSVVPFAGSSAPSGWLLCDGTSYLVATYPNLAAALNDEYGGDGGTNFNVPDMRGVFAFGKPDTGTGSALGDTGGALDHDHTQATHTHTSTAHTHSLTAHTHSSPTSGTEGDHNHTQSSTGSAGSHTHPGGSHTHTGSSLGHASTGESGSEVRHGSSATAGLWAENDLDTASDSSSHDHNNGSYYGQTTITGRTAFATFSHGHPPAQNSKKHTHTTAAVTGSVASAGTGNTGSSGSHSHTNATTGSSGDHTHTIGTTGSALTVTLSDTPAATTAGGGDTTGSENAPFQAVQYIVKAD